MRIALVVAMSKNGVIGRDNQLPWHLPADLQYFKKITMGRPIIMGRLTYESIGRPLPGRDNIVVTRNSEWQAEGVNVFVDVEEALNYGRSRAEAQGVDEVMVIGGAQIFRQVLDVADRIYLTLVSANIQGDIVFPEINKEEWRESFCEEHDQDNKNHYPYTFLTLDRM